MATKPKAKRPLTPAEQANADARRAEWAAFKAFQASRTNGDQPITETYPLVEPVPANAANAASGKLSRRERFALEDTGELVTVEDFGDLGDAGIAEMARQNRDGGHRGKVTHTTSKEGVVYDRRGIAKRVLRAAWLMQVQEPGKDGRPNFYEDCPLCGGLHPETEYDPNACPARKSAPVMVVACPARTDCPWEGRVFPEDEKAQGGVQRSKGEQLFPMTEDTRKAIGKSLALAHAWAKHPTESMGRGLPNPNVAQPQAAVA